MTLFGETAPYTTERNQEMINQFFRDTSYADLSEMVEDTIETIALPDNHQFRIARFIGSEGKDSPKILIPQEAGNGLMQKGRGAMPSIARAVAL